MEKRIENVKKSLGDLAGAVETWGLDARNSKRLLQLLAEMLRVLDKRIADLEARMGD